MGSPSLLRDHEGWGVPRALSPPAPVWAEPPPAAPLLLLPHSRGCYGVRRRKVPAPAGGGRGLLHPPFAVVPHCAVANKRCMSGGGSVCCWGPEFQGVEFLVLPHSVAPPCAFLPRSPRPVCPTAPPLVPLPVVLRAWRHPRLCPTAPFCPSVPHSCPITSTSALWGSFCAPFPLSITFFGGGFCVPHSCPTALVPL